MVFEAGVGVRPAEGAVEPVLGVAGLLAALEAVLGVAGLVGVAVLAGAGLGAAEVGLELGAPVEGLLVEGKTREQNRLHCHVHFIHAAPY